MDSISIEPIKKIEEHTQEILTKPWRSCCFELDKNCLKYFTQVFVLSGLIVLSATQLVINNDCNSQRNWSGLLMICLGTFLPSPKIN